MDKRAIVSTAVLCLLASACTLTVDDALIEDTFVYEPTSLYDLRVTWAIDRSESRSLCAAYDIETWILDIQGPEPREVYVDCRAHFWSTENDLFDLAPGSYRITNRGVNAFGRTVGALSTFVDVHDRFALHDIHLDFFGSDLR